MNLINFQNTLVTIQTYDYNKDPLKTYKGYCKTPPLVGEFFFLFKENKTSFIKHIFGVVISIDGDYIKTTQGYFKIKINE